MPAAVTCCIQGKDDNIGSFNQMFKHLKCFFSLFLWFKRKIKWKPYTGHKCVFYHVEKNLLNPSPGSFDILNYESLYLSKKKNEFYLLLEVEMSCVSHHVVFFSALLYITLKMMPLQVVLLHNDWNKLLRCFMAE